MPVATYELVAFPVILRLGGATGGEVYEFGFLAVILRLGWGYSGYRDSDRGLLPLTLDSSRHCFRRGPLG